MSAVPAIPADWALPQELLEQLGEFASRQRELQAQGHLILVLHQVPVPGTPERKSILLWRPPDANWRALSEGPEGLAPVDARDAVHQLLRDYNARIDMLEARFAEAGSAKQLFHVLRETIPVLRAMKNMLGPLTSARERLPKVRELLIWREQAHGTERAVELLYEEARAALDFTIAEEAEVQSQANLEMARASHRLNTIVAIFLPLTAIGSAFGMNVVSGLEASGPWLFWTLLSLGIVVGFSIRSFIDRSAVSVDRRLRNEIGKRLDRLKARGE